METLTRYLGKPGTESKKLTASQSQKVGTALSSALPALKVYSESPCAIAGGLSAAARDGEARKIVVCGDAGDFDGAPVTLGDASAKVCDANEANMAALRCRVKYLTPILTGKKPSFGLGDRLGVATPGHIAAAKKSGFVLVLSQQSIREMTRTGRSAQQVMDEATFGVFQSGYTAGFGADADHLKTTADVDVTAKAGFLFFTIDPSAHVDDSVNNASEAELAQKLEKMIAENVAGAAGWRKKYLDKTFTAGNATVRFDSVTLLRAAAKYGRAVAHTDTMLKHIAKVAPKHEIELSVDETALPTSAAEHLFFIHELCERGGKIGSLAPRYIGDFEKGIDYKGDLKTFETALKDHAEIAKHYGPYKLSIHSGSDKFAIYPIVARVTHGLFHLKTAGTSYLEALRVVARRDVPFFRELVAFCRDRYDTDKATYHVSAVLGNVPAATALKDAELERVYLDENDGRQVLHVTFGSVLTTTGADGKPLFRARLMSLLNREADVYVEVLKKHIGRHVEGLRAGL
jgi:hypothetical protein